METIQYRVCKKLAQLPVGSSGVTRTELAAAAQCTPHQATGVCTRLVNGPKLLKLRRTMDGESLYQLNRKVSLEELIEGCREYDRLHPRKEKKKKVTSDTSISVDVTVHVGNKNISLTVDEAYALYKALENHLVLLTN